jgi:D-cysteine desulfhydrase
VEQLQLSGADLRGDLWIKRDDLTAAECGGNKVRALEFLLGGLQKGDAVLTAGGEGSTHVLATAMHGRRLGIHTRAVRWQHEMHDVAREVEALARSLCETVEWSANPISGLARAYAHRLRSHARVRWIPPGGSSPLGILGHVNAGLELAEQIARSALPRPSRLVLPLGTGGTVAGIALGLRIAGVDTQVTGVRVVPRIAGRHGRVLRLVRSTGRLIKRYTGESLPHMPAESIQVIHEMYGGAYGRPHAMGREAARILEDQTDIRLDATYSAKAFAAALALARGAEPVTLFWLTFDARWLSH